MKSRHKGGKRSRNETMDDLAKNSVQRKCKTRFFFSIHLLIAYINLLLLTTSPWTRASVAVEFILIYYAAAIIQQPHNLWFTELFLKRIIAVNCRIQLLSFDLLTSEFSAEFFFAHLYYLWNKWKRRNEMYKLWNHL